MIFNRKKLQLIYKFFISQLFKIIYGNVVFSNKNDNETLTEAYTGYGSLINSDFLLHMF